jgi:hypothetical protein
MGLWRSWRGRYVHRAITCAIMALAPPIAMAQPPLAEAGTPAPAPAGPQGTKIDRPLAARRLVHEFTFDDPEPFAVPRYWDLAQDGSELGGTRPGFPRWNKAELDRTVASRGAGSVRLSAQGGSVCVRLKPGVIPVFPDAEYLVSAKVLTRGLTHARASLTARYLDKTNQPITASESRSDLVLGTPGAWTNLVSPLANGFADAAYIQIDLEILQPERFQTPELGEHQVWPQDFKAEAWFDDVAVVQLPRVRIATGSPSNIIERPKQPTVSIFIRDLTGEAMTGELTVQDARGRVVDKTTRAMDSGLSRWEWTPGLTELGWYRATLELRSGGHSAPRRIGATRVDFAWVDAPTDGGAAARHAPPDRDRSRFAILLTDLPAKERSLVPEILRLCGTGTVSIPVWSAGLRADQAAALAQDLVPLVERLKSNWQRLSFSLTRVPDDLASSAHVEPDEVMALFAQDAKLWGPYVDPLLDKFGQGVQRWQVGAPGGKGPGSQQLLGSLKTLHAALSRLVPGPVIALPWPGELAAPAGLTGDTRIEFLASVPYGMPAQGLPALASAWRGGAGGAGVTLVLETLPEGQYSRYDSAVAMVKSAVSLWAGQARTEEGDAEPRMAAPSQAPDLAVVQPWDWPLPGVVGHEQTMPRAEFAAYRALADRLVARRVVGMLPTPGATCYILAPAPGAPASRGGALVAWQDGVGSGEAAINAFLGTGELKLIDIFGNSRPIEPRGAGPEGQQLTHHVALSADPVFIEGVDVELARFAASFALDPARLAPTSQEHDLTVLLSNPWAMPIEGRISILEPGGLSQDPSKRDRSWRITPRSSSFAIGPRQTARIPLAVAFSAVEEAGMKDFVAEVELAGTKDYGPIRLRTGLEVGLDNTPLDLSYQVAGQDLVLEAQVTNRGTTAATFELVTVAPGYARLKASISDLAPGSTATRRFALPGGAVKLRGERVTVGVQDLESNARITRSVTVD